VIYCLFKSRSLVKLKDGTAEPGQPFRRAFRRAIETAAWMAVAGGGRYGIYGRDAGAAMGFTRASPGSRLPGDGRGVRADLAAGHVSGADQGVEECVFSTQGFVDVVVHQFESPARRHLSRPVNP
jgi:hypothetical protein